MLLSRDGYRFDFIDTDIDTGNYWYYLVQKDMIWKAVENFKLFHYCWTLATVLKFFSQEQGVVFLCVLLY